MAFEALPKDGIPIVYDQIIDDERRTNAAGDMFGIVHTGICPSTGNRARSACVYRRCKYFTLSHYCW
jgi:hypothetical protein